MNKLPYNAKAYIYEDKRWEEIPCDYDNDDNPRMKLKSFIEMIKRHIVYVFPEAKQNHSKIKIKLWHYDENWDREIPLKTRIVQLL